LPIADCQLPILARYRLGGALDSEIGNRQLAIGNRLKPNQ